MIAPTDPALLDDVQTNAPIEQLFTTVARLEKGQRGKSDRPPGGRKGRQGRALERVAEPDFVLDHRPGRCEGCGADLAEAATVRVGRRQVFDLRPMPKVTLTEQRALTLVCPCCTAKTRGEFGNTASRL